MPTRRIVMSCHRFVRHLVVSSSFALAMLGIVPACVDSGGGSPEGGALTKEDARARGRSADWGRDPCEEYGWYGDGVCDTFCPETDPDCGSSECSADSDCASGERCVPGELCYHWCAAGDPSCCVGNACEAVASPPGSDCSSDADCASGERCVPGDLCYTWCAAGDPSCCVGNTCEAVAPVSDGECSSDADCGTGETCVPGELCYHWCPAGDPSCCLDNHCE